MAFNVAPGIPVGSPAETFPWDGKSALSLRPTPLAPLTALDANNTRQLILAEILNSYGRLEPSLGALDTGTGLLTPMNYSLPPTEDPFLDDTEIWEIYNATPDAHPIHLHLVHFFILDRQKFTATQDPITGVIDPATIVKKNMPVPPPPDEAGMKDTVQAYPGEVTRVIATFDKPGEYVWHCHILSHEDHEMMRPFEVIAPTI